MQSRVENKHLQSQTLVTCPLQLSPVTAGVGALSHYVFSVSYNILLNNEHLSQFKCCGCPKIGVCHEGGRLDQRQWNKRRVLLQTSARQ